MVAGILIDGVLLLAAYALGCFSTGYYLTRLIRGEDIRDQGSGSTGSRNVSRSLGAWGFTIVFLIDVGKGAAAVLLARHFGTDPWVACVCFPIVVAGHVWPCQLAFRGGKGLATALGGAFVVDLQLISFGLLLCVLLLLYRRNLIFAGLVAITLCPVWFLMPLFFPKASFLTPVPFLHVCSFILVCAIILFAHRDNIREDIFKTGPRGKPNSSSAVGSGSA